MCVCEGGGRNIDRKKKKTTKMNLRSKRERAGNAREWMESAAREGRSERDPT